MIPFKELAYSKQGRFHTPYRNPSRGTFLLFLFLLTLCYSLIACKDQDKEAKNPTAETSGLIPPKTGTAALDDVPSPPAQDSDAYAERTIVYDLNLIAFESMLQFEEKVKELLAEVEGYCQDLSEQKLTDLRQLWKETAAIWQILEMMQYGPLNGDQSDLKYQIYSWPFPINLCRIDLGIVESSQDEAFVIGTQFSRKGLGTAEYLLFEESLTAQCATTVPSLAEWNQKSDTERRTDRCRYLELVIQDLHGKALELIARWYPVDGYFATSLTPEQASETLKEIATAVFYIETETKDRKLGEPLGLVCADPNKTCSENFENFWSRESRTALIQNLKGFKSLLTGDRPDTIVLRNSYSPENGLTELLSLKNAGDLGTRLLSGTDSALNRLSQDQDRLESIVPAEKAGLCDTLREPAVLGRLCDSYQDIRQIATQLKDEFATILEVSIPEEAQQDSD